VCLIGLPPASAGGIQVVIRRADPETSMDFIGFVKTVWAYIQLFDWPLVASVLFSSCLVAHFVCFLERLDTIKAPHCLLCNLPDNPESHVSTRHLQVQLELTIETSLLYKIVLGNLVVPSEAALLLVSIFGSCLDDYERSCGKYLHP
jgi:hypothetical protein